MVLNHNGHFTHLYSTTHKRSSPFVVQIQVILTELEMERSASGLFRNMVG